MDHPALNASNLMKKSIWLKRVNTITVCQMQNFIFYFQFNTITENLDLGDNFVEAEGATYIAAMLKENTFITSLVRIVLRIISLQVFFACWGSQYSVHNGKFFSLPISRRKFPTQGTKIKLPLCDIITHCGTVNSIFAFQVLKCAH